MSLICRRRIPLSLENMSQMSSTIATSDFRTLHAEGGVRMSRYGTGDRVEVRGPAATRFKFVGCFVKGMMAGYAGLFDSISVSGRELKVVRRM